MNNDMIASYAIDYILVPTLLFVGIIFTWFIQSLALLFVTRKYILPTLYRYKITEWFIVEFAIAIHELSHLFAALFTGSEINLRESFVTSRAGRIAARASSSIGGWISIIIAAFAPAFIPSLVLFIVSVAFFHLQIPFYKVLDAKPNIDLDDYVKITFSIISPLFNFLLSLIISPSLWSLVLVYFILVASLTSTPSEDDWAASKSVLFSFSVFPLLAAFLLLYLFSVQFNFNLLLFTIVLLSIILLYIAFGILFNLIFVGLIHLLRRLWRFLLHSFIKY